MSVRVEDRGSLVPIRICDACGREGTSEMRHIVANLRSRDACTPRCELIVLLAACDDLRAEQGTLL